MEQIQLSQITSLGFGKMTELEKLEGLVTR
jgi:hypothetical protein